MKSYTHRLLAATAIITLSLAGNMRAAAETEKKSYPAQAWYITKKVIGTYCGLKPLLWGTQMGFAVLTRTPDSLLQTAISDAAKKGEAINEENQKEMLKVFELSLSKWWPMVGLSLGSYIIYRTWGTELRNYLKKVDKPTTA